MTTQRKIGFIAVLTPLWFLVTYLAMSAARPEYSHVTDAISELGSWDATNLWAWNILGYILPGCAIALLGIGLFRAFPALRRTATVPSVALICAGLLMALSGVFPANMADFESTTTVMHTVGSFGTYIAFLFAGFGFPACFRRSPSWHWVAYPSLALVLGSIATGFLRFGDMGGVGQRLTFAFFFLWVALVGFGLLRASPRRTSAARHVAPADSALRRR